MKFRSNFSKISIYNAVHWREKFWIFSESGAKRVGLCDSEKIDRNQPYLHTRSRERTNLLGRSPRTARDIPHRPGWELFQKILAGNWLVQNRSWPRWQKMRLQNENVMIKKRGKFCTISFVILTQNDSHHKFFVISCLYSKATLNSYVT